MSSTPTDARCPRCGDPIQPDAGFCGTCGEPVSRRADTVDAQDTVMFRPVDANRGADGGTDPMLADPVGGARSPWAQPGSVEYTQASPVTPAENPGALLAAWGGMPETSADRTAATTSDRGPRGFFLGLLAVLLILAVLALYTYDAWLGEDARETVEGWLPWLT